MTTKPKHDPASIAQDARAVLAAARADDKIGAFHKRLHKGELNTFETEIEALESGDAARTTRRHAQVAAGVHVAEVSAAIAIALLDLRDDAKIQFPGDVEILRGFGVGAKIEAARPGPLRRRAMQTLDAAKAHPAAAKAIAFDTKAQHALEAQIHALDGTQLAQIHAADDRHATSIATDSLAHKVSTEAAHVRLIAHRAFRGDAAKLARYDTTLPRHEVVPRGKPAPAPTEPGAPAAK